MSLREREQPKRSPSAAFLRSLAQRAAASGARALGDVVRGLGGSVALSPGDDPGSSVRSRFAAASAQDVEDDGYAVTRPNVSAAPPAALESRVGPYRIGPLLGRGTSAVYRATAPDGRPVAVKTLSPMQMTTTGIQRFNSEHRVQIRHPNIVEVLDAGVDNAGIPYLVLELLEGETLEERLRRTRLSPAEIVRVGVQLCRGLALVHAANIVHRDVKPSNVFLCWDGGVKIIDFGVARMPGGDRTTPTGDVIGTIAYISPEQARGSDEVDPRSDLWALGAVLYEALSGRPPYFHSPPDNLLLARLHADPTSLAAHAWPGTPGDLVAVVDRCLRIDPARRCPSALSLARDLARVRIPGNRGYPSDRVIRG